MSQQSLTSNRRITLAKVPQGEPKESDFKIDSIEVPKIQDGEVLLRTVYLSLDPYMRGRMSTSKSYAKSLEIGDVIVGGTVCKVQESKNDKYKVGDWVLAYSGWQDYITSKGEGLINLGSKPTHQPSFALGVLGMPGCTGYMGLMKIGEPKAGEVVVVAAATGPVGSIVGQIAKLKGCYVIGIAGGEEKCKYAVEKQGFDKCLDHRDPNLGENLSKAIHEAKKTGIDIYWENVGGKVFDAVFPLLNTKARIPVCGLISMYNSTELPKGPVDRLPLLEGAILTKRMRVQGFIVTLDYWDQFNEFYSETSKWLTEGKIHYLEQVVDGFDNTISSFIGLLKGHNFGKLVMKLGNDSI